MRKITEKRKRLLSALLAAALACLSACGNSAGTAGGSSQGEDGQAEPGYQGPLYRLSFTKMTDRLPEFQDFTSSCVNLFSVNQYYGIELMTHFAQEDTIGIGTYQYCDGDYNYLSVGEDRKFLAYHDGYRMFLWMPTNTINREGWAIEVYDQDMNLVSTTADRFEDLSYGFAQLYLETGWLPLKEKATGLDGFFNVYTQEWRPLSSSEECLRAGGTYLNLITSNSFYSDGLAYVTSSGFAREYYAPTGLKNHEKEVLGFLDESGQYAFRFEDLPEFDGLLVNMVTGFCDGTCMVAARYDDGAFSVPLPSEDAPYHFYQVEYEWIAPEGYQLPEDQKADLSSQGLMRYWDFQDILLTGSIWMGGPAPENDPVMEVEIYCEGTGFGEDTGPIQAQETARCSYRPAQEEYSTFTAGGEVLGQSWVVDLVYLLADPKFLDEAGNKSYSWSGSCSWTDENGQTQTQELSIL